jgi:hypothetical protein
LTSDLSSTSMPRMKFLKVLLAYDLERTSFWCLSECRGAGAIFATWRHLGVSGYRLGAEWLEANLGAERIRWYCGREVQDNKHNSRSPSWI